MEQIIASLELYLDIFVNKMNSYQVLLGLNPYIILGLAFMVGALTVGYFRNYHFPAIWLRSELMAIIRKLKSVRAEDGISQKLLKRNIDDIFAKSPFKNIWLDFCQSLHINYEYNRKENIKEIFATLPSSRFFSKETIIDIQINSVFYRHLPSILIGFSTIVAFTSIVWGLYEFSFSYVFAVESLPAILQQVTSAFIGSALGIIASVFISYKEKAILNKSYMAVDELNKEIDSMYLMGVHEEYLSRIVKFSEGAPNAINEIKDDFVSSLIIINERQIEAQRIQNEAIATQVALAVKDALLEPMTEITSVLREVKGDQTQALSKTLETLVNGFMSEVKTVVGKQMEDVNSSIKMSSEVLKNVHSSMMSSQENINLRMQESQQQVSESMDSTMKSVLSSIQDSVISLAIERKQQVKQDEERNNNLVTSLDNLYSNLSVNVEKLSSDIKESTFKTAENFESIQQLTMNVLSEMKSGAEVIDKAAGRFSEAGNKMSDITGVISSTSETMGLTALSVKESFEEYDKSRVLVKEQVDELKTMISSVKQESEIKQKLVEDMELIVKSLETAERHSTEYLDSINNVLKGSFEDFGIEMVNQVRNISTESNKHLGSSLEVLSGTVESMVDSVTKLRRAA